MTFNQWLYLIIAALTAISAHRAGIMLLAHNLDVKWHAIKEDAKPDILGQVATLLPMVLEMIPKPQETPSNAQENSQQSQSSSKAPQSPSGSG